MMSFSKIFLRKGRTLRQTVLSILIGLAPSLAHAALPPAQAPAPLGVSFMPVPPPDISTCYWMLRAQDAATAALSQSSGLPLIHHPNCSEASVSQRTFFHDDAIVIGPSSYIAQAVAAGYTPLVATPGTGTQGVDIVALASQPLRTMSDARVHQHDLRLGTLQPFMVATFDGNAFLRISGMPIRRFKSVKVYQRNSELLTALLLHEIDIAAVGALNFDRLNQSMMFSGHPVKGQFRVLDQFKGDAPNMGVAVLPSVSIADRARLATAFGLPNPALKAAGVPVMTPSTAKDYAKLSQLVQYVPASLSGAIVINANQTRQLIQEGAIIIDARSNGQYQSGHIPGAISVPYQEHSAPDVNFDPDKDHFDWLQAEPNRSKTYIFACNGVECWKSYKAATFALQHGYAHVLWFRGGFPAWTDAQFPVDKGPKP
jgi:rhodanese-related sulfurtransferase